MRPVRVYQLRFIREHAPVTEPVKELTFQTAGRTSCIARRMAFQLLEQTLKRNNLPRHGWRLMAQVPMPNRS